APHDSQRTCSWWPWVGSKRALPSPSSTRETAPSASRKASALNTDEKSAATPRAASSAVRSSIDQSWRELSAITLRTASLTWLGLAMRRSLYKSLAHHPGPHFGRQERPRYIRAR